MNLQQTQSLFLNCCIPALLVLRSWWECMLSKSILALRSAAVWQRQMNTALYTPALYMHCCKRSPLK